MVIIMDHCTISQLTECQQMADGEHQVAYLSKKLLPREQNYSMIEKELLAIVWAVGSLSYYLDGRYYGPFHYFH
jgi:hypothetical protein